MSRVSSGRRVAVLSWVAVGCAASMTLLLRVAGCAGRPPDTNVAKPAPTTIEKQTAVPVRKAPVIVADSIYTGGDIVTVNFAAPSVEALAVKDGKILAIGNKADVLSHQGDVTKMVDLEGKTMIPGMIDSHSRFVSALAMAKQANVSAPPVGPAHNPREIVAELRKFAILHDVKRGEFVVGYGYDESLMPEGQALTRDVLDPAFPNNPVVVIHVSGEAGVLNSVALKRFGISQLSRNPAGGVIARKPKSYVPTGLLTETAWVPIMSQLPAASTPEQETAQLTFAQNLYFAAGVTTAQDGATKASDVELLSQYANKGDLLIDLVAYPFFFHLDDVLKKHPPRSFGRYERHFKLGGCKIAVDGTPQSRTAYFVTPYLTSGPAGEEDWKGVQNISQDTLNAFVKRCYDDGLQLLVHANGDAAIDMVLRAHEYAAPESLDKDRRTTVIHAQFARRDQLKRFADYKIIPSFCTEKTFFFSNVNLKNRGKEQTYFSNPMKSAAALGLEPTNHTDFNEAPIDQMFAIWSAVNRVSRNGEIIGPDERVGVLDALKAVTIDGAHQYFEEKTKGTIEVGKVADLVILDKNPFETDPAKLKNIKVVETIKDGRSVYQAPP